VYSDIQIKLSISILGQLFAFLRVLREAKRFMVQLYQEDLLTKLTHLDSEGRPTMVDVTAKEIVHRVARATGSIRLQPQTIALIESGGVKKGNVLTTAELAGIQAAKRTGDLIPLCHPLPLSHVEVRAELTTDGVMVNSSVTCVARTGVEMEALTAVQLALLTVYDMCKAVDKTMVMEGVQLVEKKKTPLEK